MLLAAASISSSPPKVPDHHEALMDEIERSVVLPKGAASLSAYGRNYAISKRGTVIAVYLKPMVLPEVSAQGCEIMLENFKSRACTKKEIAEDAARNARAAAAQTPAGKRRWFERSTDLPYIADGGCTQVNVEYDVVSHNFLRIACNGFA